MSGAQRQRIALAIGDPNGIGPEIAIKAARDLAPDETIEIVLKRSGLHVEGPSGADLMLGRTDMDAFVAMYHDQGHIPVKLIAGRDSAAMTIGADLMFASVGHGSAFDIAGRGVADPRALLRSLALVSGKKSFGTHAGQP